MIGKDQGLPGPAKTRLKKRSSWRRVVSAPASHPRNVLPAPFHYITLYYIVAVGHSPTLPASRNSGPPDHHQSRHLLLPSTAGLTTRNPRSSSLPTLCGCRLPPTLQVRCLQGQPFQQGCLARRMLVMQPQARLLSACPSPTPLPPLPLCRLQVPPLPAGKQRCAGLPCACSTSNGRAGS